jgi:osmoprotectant transport system permease protein
LIGSSFIARLNSWLVRLLSLSILLATANTLQASGQPQQPPIIIGTKSFTEAYILGEIMAQLLEAHHFKVTRKFALGGTLVAYSSLVAGKVNVIPEYTGTVARTILKLPNTPGIKVMNQYLAKVNLELLKPFGFNNTYALVISQALQKQLNIYTLSDLAKHPKLNFGLANEFLSRPDGWPGLKEAYGLTARPVGVAHALSYAAIANNKIDVTNAYTTDGDIKRYHLVVLQDNKHYFPNYFAVPLVNKDVGPQAIKVLDLLANKISAQQIRQLNGLVANDKQPIPKVAHEFLISSGLISPDQAVQQPPALWQKMVDNIIIHLQLTLTALALACLVGLLLSLLVYRRQRVARIIVYIASLLQTIPSIALLALMIPLFGIGALPAIVALFLYSLLPIIRATIIALNTIDKQLIQVAEAMGLSRWQQTRILRLPLALPHILAGVKTATIISIGTATLAAFIGAGGLGEPIVTGITLNDTGLILQGAIPAACLAIIAELLFEALERLLVPGHLVTKN